MGAREKGTTGGFNHEVNRLVRSFKKPEDLMNVKGIGEKAFLKLKPYLTVTDRPEKSGL